MEKLFLLVTIFFAFLGSVLSVIMAAESRNPCGMYYLAALLFLMGIVFIRVYREEYRCNNFKQFE